MNNLTKAAIGIAGSVALASGIYYSTREPTRDVGTLTIADQVGVFSVAKTKTGKQVRMVGAYTDKAKEEDTEFGKAFVLEGVPSEAFCNIVFSADVVKKDGRDWPDIKGIENLLNAGALPVLVSMDDDDVGIWNCLFKGDSCLAMAELENYVGSDVHQFINQGKRKYLLKTKAKAGTNNKDVVAIDDIDADPAAEVWFGHEWAGRPDLSMASYQSGTVTSKVEKLRLEREAVEKKNEK